MTDMEKMQLEIENDLRKLGLMASEPEAEQDGEVNKTISLLSDEIETEEPEILLDTFYSETIKQNGYTLTPPSKVSWRKRLITVCIICTLGTGTLGFGAGAAVVLADYFWLGGINREITGETLTDRIIGIESARYVFSGGEDAQEGTLSDMVKLVEPSVVKVSSAFQTGTGVPFFSGNVSEEQQEEIGNASGIIFREDRNLVYIATNYHVVGGAARVNVIISDGEPVSAKQVGMNREADLAVISVSKRDLRNAGVTEIVLATFGDSDYMEVGDSVIAIGNALGEGNISTGGIISAKEKVIPVEGRNLTVLQTDAAIINMNGEVIGINSAKLYSYAVEGMGYSISSNIAVPILEDLMQTPSKPSIGIYGATITTEQAAELGIPPMGVYVDSIIPGTGAENAGILPGDVITGFNGDPVIIMEHLIESISRCKVGDTVEVKILRGGRSVNLKAVLQSTVTSGFNN